MLPRVPNPLYMLAFDHRQVLRDLYRGVEEERFPELKLVASEVLGRVAAKGVDRRSLGYLVDEEYGADAARRAIDSDMFVAMPIEASRTPIFMLQYPDDHDERFARFNPACVKALVFQNPADPAARRHQQIADLAAVAQWARKRRFRLLLEVLVTPTEHQLAASGGDLAAFRANALPTLLAATIAEYQDGGVHPDLWKIEGLESPDAYRVVVDQIAQGDQLDAQCIVLGSGASLEDVTRWLANARDVAGVSGFAVGRSVWWQPLGKLLDGTCDREEVVDEMTDSFMSLVAAFDQNTATAPGYR